MQLRSLLQVRPLAASRFALLSLLALHSTTPAHALTVLEACLPSDSILVCRLKAILTMLYTAAGILAILLAIAVTAAILVYRRNVGKFKAKDINPNAD